MPEYQLLLHGVQANALADSNSFNTLLTTSNGAPVSWTVRVLPGQGTEIQGGTNSAPIQGQGVNVCRQNPVRAHCCTVPVPLQQLFLSSVHVPA